MEKVDESYVYDHIVYGGLSNLNTIIRLREKNNNKYMGVEYMKNFQIRANKRLAGILT
jgi:hypothetical protein